MAALTVVHTPELKGLYANSNRFTIPKGNVPRLCNLYMIRRGALHTVPGSKWVSSFDGLAPHVRNQQPIVHLRWYSPSSGSSPALFVPGSKLTNAPAFLLALQQVATPLGVNLLNASSATFSTLASQNGTVSALSNSAQIGDYLAVAFGNSLPPNIYPTATQLSAALSASANKMTVSNTLPFPATVGTNYVLVDGEAIQYTGTTMTSFTGLTRGALGTTAASHASGATVEYARNVGGTAIAAPWNSIVNNFDPTLIYGQWPGRRGTEGPTAAAAVNIGALILVFDGANTAWLFRAQVAGVTGYGTTSIPYMGPQFFPNGYIAFGAMTAGSPTLTLVQNTPGTGKFTAALAGQPILVRGAGAGDDKILLSTVLPTGFVDATHLTLADNAVNTITSRTFFIGTGSFGDTARDENEQAENGTEVWRNVGQAALAPPGAAFVIQHLNNLYLWGVSAAYGTDGLTGPDALWQSDNGQPLIFNPANVTFAGKGDGTQAQGAAVYSLAEAGIAATPQLVLFKDATTYSFLNSFASGSGASLQQVPGGLGCIAPSTIQYIGGLGVMRLCYAGVALFDGQLEHVTEYTDAIRGYLFGGLADVTAVDFANIQKCVSTQVINPPMYIFFAPLQNNSGYVTRGFGYDFGLKQWCVIDLPFAISAASFMPQAVTALVAAYQILIGGSTDGVIRRIFAGDSDWDSIAVTWNLQFPDWGFPGTPVYVRRLNPYITADGGGATPKLTAASLKAVRRSSQAFSRALNVPVGVLGSLDVGETVLSASLKLSGQGQVLIEGSDAQTSEKPMGRVGK